MMRPVKEEDIPSEDSLGVRVEQARGVCTMRPTVEQKQNPTEQEREVTNDWRDRSGTFGE
jgi:hypothetical protein